jgi:Ca2+-binding EF-hand superfamily protein
MRTKIAALALAPALSVAAATGGGMRSPEQFRSADTDGNGMLSRAEVQRAVPRLVQHFDAIDVNRDGQISPEEIRAFRRAGRGGTRTRHSTPQGAGVDGYFARADTDGDGALSRSEAELGLPRVAKKFERIDSDGDGRLTLEELKAWIALRRAARGG